MNARKQEQVKDFSRYVNEFCSRYRAKVRRGGTLRRSKPIQYNEWKYEADFRDVFMETYDLPAVDITISEEDLSKLVNDLAEFETGDYAEYVRMKRSLGDHFMLDLYEFKGRQAREERARQENPGVQKAWENYQLMLKLVGG